LIRVWRAQAPKRMLKAYESAQERAQDEKVLGFRMNAPVKRKKN
jgi:hypothetical protein